MVGSLAASNGCNDNVAGIGESFRGGEPDAGGTSGDENNTRIGRQELTS
jgi:hypothetical protein